MKFDLNKVQTQFKGLASLLLIVISCLFLLSCKKETKEVYVFEEVVVEKVVTETITHYPVQSTWWELPQYFEGVPKYSGSFGTYTAKHTPSAVSCELGDWAVYTDNSTGVVKVYSLNLNTGQSYLIHTNRVDNAHQQGSIQCIDDVLTVGVAALGFRELGGLYESTDGMTWERKTKDYKAYYQMTNTDVFFYTLYEKNGDSANGMSRFIYSSCNDSKINDEGSTGSYMLSHYDGSYYHVVYNKHPKGVVDKRYGLFYRKSVDGCIWSEESAWYDGDGLVFLKDFNNVNGEMTALFTISTSANPLEGNRGVYTSVGGVNTHQFDTNHNYTAGVIMSDGKIFFPNNDIDYYAGGSFKGMPYVNYLKRVEGLNNKVIMSTGISPKFKSDSWIVGFNF